MEIGLPPYLTAGEFERGGERDATIPSPHAIKIGELTVERDSFCAGWRAEPSGADRDDRPRLRIVAVPVVRAARREPVVLQR